MQNFDSKTSIKRTFDYIAKPEFWDDATAEEKRLFLALSNGFQSAFAFRQVITSAITQYSWNWWLNPAAVMLSSAKLQNFWLPPDDQIDIKELQKLNPLTRPWLFHADMISLEAYNAAGARKVVGVEEIRNGTIASFRDSIVGAIDHRLTLLGFSPTTAPKQRMIWSLRDFENSTASTGYVGALFDYGIAPGLPIIFDGVSGLVNTDFIEVRAVGKFKIHPRIVPVGDRIQG